MRLPLAFALSSAVLALPLEGQLVKDFSPGPSTVGYQLGDARAVVGDRLLFDLNDPELGRTVWTVSLSDPEAHPPELLTDFSPDAFQPISSPTTGVNVPWVGPQLAFLTVTESPFGAARQAAWASDGTPGGTRELAADLDAASLWLGQVPGTHQVLFNATHPASGAALWASDGTPEGTRQLASVLARTTNGGGLDRGVPWQGRLVFLVGPTGQDQRLWVSDGTPAGTAPLPDPHPGPTSSAFGTPVVAGDRLYFTTALVPTGARELWELASPSGTLRRIATTGPGSPFGDGFSALRAAGRQVFFLAGSGATAGLWRYDPQASPPFLLVLPGVANNAAFVGLTSFGASTDRAIAFWTQGFTGSTETAQVWVSDGTLAGSRRVFQVTGDQAVVQFSPVVRAEDGFVWAVSSFDAGTQGVWRVRPGEAAANRAAPIGTFSNVFALGDSAVAVGGGMAWAVPADTRPVTALFGIAGDPSTTRCALNGARTLWACLTLHPDGSAELFSTAGTPATTREFDLGQAFPPLGASSVLGPALASGSGVLIQAFDATEPEGLWSSDGTVAGTRLVRDRASLGGTVGALAAGTQHGFVAVRSSSSDPACGVFAVPHANPAAATCVLPGAGVVAATVVAGQGEVYFADTRRWYRTAGANAAVVLAESPGDWGLGEVVTTAQGAFLLAADELWFSDGTPAGTRSLRSEIGGAANLLSVAGQAVFTVTNEAGTSALWSSDGTVAGTRERLVYPAGLRLLQTVGAGSRLFLSAVTTVDPWQELWVVDFAANPLQFVRLRRLQPLAAVGRAAVLTASGDRVVFPLPELTTGQELWSSDGTVAGTRRVFDLFPGAVSASPREITPLPGGLVAFSAADPDGGREPWLTDGTPEGTRRLIDLAPGRRSSYPVAFALVNGAVFFAASDGVHGRELFAVPLAGLPGQTPEPPPGAWLASGAVPGFRFKVRIGDAPGVAGTKEPGCLPETLCVSGALPGRAEVFLRVVGPRPNGKLWPTLIKFTTGVVHVWIEQTNTGERQYYRLDGARPDFDELPGRFDREGFEP